MDRRSFLRSMVDGVAVGAAVRTWPFRVFSFPSDIRIAHWYDSWEEFDISRVPPIHLDPKIWAQIRTVGGFYPGAFGSDNEVRVALDEALCSGVFGEGL